MGGRIGSFDVELLGALSSDGDEYAAFGISVKWEVGAPYDTDLDLGVDDQGEANSVLLPSKEAFGTINGIDGPHSCHL